VRGHRDGQPAGQVQFGLARFAGSVLTEPDAYCGGAASATVVRRRDTVAYGYLGVVDEYARPEAGVHWRVLTLTLPGRVPHLTVDHVSALGRPGVVAPGSSGVGTADSAFDALYVVSADDAAVVARVLTPAVRQLLVGLPVQRFALDERQLMLRTFDAAAFTPDVDDRLAGLAGSILGSAPSFVSTTSWSGAPAPGGVPAGAAPLLPGVYGKDEPPEPDDAGLSRSGLVTAGLVVLAAALVLVAAIVVLVLI